MDYINPAKDKLMIILTLAKNTPDSSIIKTTGHLQWYIDATIYYIKWCIVYETNFNFITQFNSQLPTFLNLTLGTDKNLILNDVAINSANFLTNLQNSFINLTINLEEYLKRMDMSST